jgi:ABC-2 type transport system permease protein
MTPKSVIYDQGYRRYEGRYLGRGYAIWSLFASDLRRALGVKRSWQYQVGLGILATIIFAQALTFFFVSTVGPAALINPQAMLFDGMSFFLLILSAMIAPDLLCTDRRYRVLPLYLVRPIELYDYLLAKQAVLVGVVALASFIPQLGIFLAKALIAPSALEYVSTHGWMVGASAAASLVYALFYGAIASAIAALTPRWSYAAGAIIAVPVALGLASGIITILTKNPWWQLLDILSFPSALKDALFGVTIQATTFTFRMGREGEIPREVTMQPLETWIYGVATGAFIVGALGILFARYVRARYE